MEGGVGGDQVDIQSLRRSIRWICSKARYAIGVTATPINIHSKEIVDILQLLGSEQTDLKEIPKDPLEPIQWMESLGKVSSWARGEEDPEEALHIYIPRGGERWRGMARATRRAAGRRGGRRRSGRSRGATSRRPPAAPGRRACRRSPAPRVRVRVSDRVRGMVRVSMPSVTCAKG